MVLFGQLWREELSRRGSPAGLHDVNPARPIESGAAGLTGAGPCGDGLCWALISFDGDLYGGQGGVRAQEHNTLGPPRVREAGFGVG